MQRKQAVTIKLTETNKLIFDRYEKTRPQRLSGMAMSASFVVVQPTDNEDEGLFAKMATKVTDAVVVGEAGALFGQKGVGAIAAYVAGKTLIGHIFERAHKDETIQIVNLNYLEPTAFISNPRIGDSLEQSVSRLETFKKLYHHALTYQKLKGTRFGFKLFGIKFGDYRDDDLIDDPKYLVNILIGRKIRRAAEAKTKEDCELQLKHLLQFLQAIVVEPEITHSKSDDTSYLSIRSVINTVKKELSELAEKEMSKADEDTLYNILEKNIDKTVMDATTLFNEVLNRTTYLTCDIMPDDFRYLRAPKLEEPSSYPKMLLDFLYGSHVIIPEQLNEQLNTFITGLKEYADIHDLKNEKQLKTIFNNIIENKERLRKLLETLKSFDKIKVAGLNAFITLSEELTYLLQEIKKTQFVLIKTQKAFADALSVNFSASKNQLFKNAFTQYAYTPLVMDIKPINEAIITLEQISLNKDEKRAELEDEIQRLTARFKTETLLCGYTPSMQSAPDDHVEFEAAEETEDDALKEWVQVELEKSADFADQLPGDVKELPWYKKMFSDAELRHKYAELQQQHVDLQQQLTDKEVVITTNQATIETLKKEKTTAVSQQNRLEQRYNLKSRVGLYANDFSLFIKDYLDRNKACWSFFHGKSGRTVAKKFEKIFRKELRKILTMLDNDASYTPATLKYYVYTRFTQLLNEQQELLVGGYRPHSLKTYLLAYTEYLNADEQDDTVDIQQRPSIVAKYHQAEYVYRKDNNVKAIYERITGVNPEADKPVDAMNYLRQ